MLILPKGYQAWKDELSQVEYHGTLEKATVRETGFTQTEHMDKRDDIHGTILKWDLPDTFCPDCERTTIDPTNAFNGSQGVWTFDEPRPEIKMRPGDVLLYNVCGDCREAAIWDDSSKLQLPPSYRAKFRRAQRIAQNCVLWIKARIISGEEPVNEGHSYVKG